MISLSNGARPPDHDIIASIIYWGPISAQESRLARIYILEMAAIIRRRKKPPTRSSYRSGIRIITDAREMVEDKTAED